MSLLDGILGSKEVTGSASFYPFLYGWGKRGNVAGFPRTYQPNTMFSPAVMGRQGPASVYSNQNMGAYTPPSYTQAYPQQQGSPQQQAYPQQQTQTYTQQQSPTYGIAPEIAQMIQRDPAVAQFWQQLAADPTLASRLSSMQQTGGQASSQVNTGQQTGGQMLGQATNFNTGQQTVLGRQSPAQTAVQAPQAFGANPILASMQQKMRLAGDTTVDPDWMGKNYQEIPLEAKTFAEAQAEFLRKTRHIPTEEERLAAWNSYDSPEWANKKFKGPPTMLWTDPTSGSAYLLTGQGEMSPFLGDPPKGWVPRQPTPVPQDIPPEYTQGTGGAAPYFDQSRGAAWGPIPQTASAQSATQGTTQGATQAGQNYRLPSDIQPLYDTDPAVKQFWDQMAADPNLGSYWASQAANPERKAYWSTLLNAINSGAQMPAQTPENFDAAEYMKAHPGTTMQTAYADWQRQNPQGGNFPYLPALVAGLGQQGAGQAATAGQNYGLTPEIQRLYDTDPAVKQYWDEMAADPQKAAYWAEQARLQSTQQGQTTGQQGQTYNTGQQTVLGQTYTPSQTYTSGQAYTSGQPPAQQIGSISTGGRGQLENYYYDFEANNSVPQAPGEKSQIPGTLPSIANEILNGPPPYYPWQDVAQKSAGQQSADDLLRYWADLTGGGQGALAEQLKGAQAQQWLAGVTASQAGNITPTYDVARSPNGLSDFLNPYTASPNLNQVIGDAASDSARYMNELLLPKDRASAISGGQYGGSRSGIAEGITRRGVGEEITQMANQTRYNDYLNYLQNKLSAGGQILQGDIGLANAGTARGTSMADTKRDMLGLSSDMYLNSASINSGAWDQAMGLNDTMYQRGLMDRAMQQEAIDADKARWDYGMNSPLDWLMRYHQAVIGSPAGPDPRVDYKPGALDYAVALFGGGDNSMASGIKKIFS